jgi:hypothetical protein
MDGETVKATWRALYDEAFDRFGVVALWSCARNASPTADDARAVARTLRRQGDMAAWRLADRLNRACDAA